MQPGREWKSVPKDTNRNAGSGLGTDAHLTVLAMSFRRELLDEAMVGVGIERQAVWATEFGTTQGPGEGVRVIADDHILSRFLGRAMPVIDGLAGQCAMVVDDEGGRDVGRVENNRRPRLRAVLGLTAEARRAEAVEIQTLRSGRAALFLRACGGHDVLKCTIAP